MWIIVDSFLSEGWKNMSYITAEGSNRLWVNTGKERKEEERKFSIAENNLNSTKQTK